MRRITNAKPGLFVGVVLATAIFVNTVLAGSAGLQITALTHAAYAADGASPTSQSRPSGAEGIGIYPTTLQFDDALRGGDFYRTVGVLNGSDAERTYRFDAEGEIASWLSIVGTEDRAQVLDAIQAPPWGEGRVLIRLQIPPEAANGEYSGLIRVYTELGKDPGGQSTSTTVNLGALLSVDVTVVGAQTIAGSMIDVTTSDIEVGMPLKLHARVQNSGNVQVNPNMRLKIINTEGEVVGESSFSGQVIYPAEIKDLLAEWDSRGLIEGEYTAQLSADMEDVTLETKDAKFEILPVGTLRSSGKTQNLSLVNQPQVGDVAKVVVTFHNTGQMDVLSKFVGELYIGPRLIGTVTSEELLAPIGELVNLEVYTALPEKGEYTIKGKVIYGGKETESQQISFSATPEGSASDQTSSGDRGGVSFWKWLVIGLSSIVGAGVITAATSLLRRRWWVPLYRWMTSGLR